MSRHAQQANHLAGTQGYLWQIGKLVSLSS